MRTHEGVTQEFCLRAIVSLGETYDNENSDRENPMR